MPQSVTRNWEYKVYKLVEHIIIKIVIPNPLFVWNEGDDEVGLEAGLENNDDGELASELEAFLIAFIEEIEDCSSFEADKHLSNIIRNLTKVVAHDDRGTGVTGLETKAY